MADGHPNTSLNARSSSSSGGGGGGGGGAARSSHRSLVQLSQIERSVGHLLVATKQLLETLTQWSRQQASETEVSDVYVRLGYEFNLACRAFQSIGVDTSDLGPVPDMLRTILEDTLSQEALPESLERYLPRIRDIIINLLHGLKRKQTRLRSRTQQQLQQSQREREREASRAAADGQQASVRRDSGGNAEPGVAAAAAAAVPGAGAGQEAGIEPPAYLPPQSPSSPDPAAAAAG
ncbi:Bud site selection protein 6, partial [Ascosphaera acerosa]